MDQSYEGRGELNKLKTIIQENNFQRIFLVTGAKSFEGLGMKERIEKMLAGRIYFRYSEFSQNPRYEDLLAGIKKVQEFSPDVIVGIGGGSVLDMAKLLSVLSEEKADVFNVVTGKMSVPKRKKALVLIPTTAGSGSECTHFAVVYLDKIKYSIADRSLLPDYAIVDPELTYTAPRSLTASTILDALSQAIESYWAVSSTQESRDYAAASIRSIVKNFDSLIFEPNEQTREAAMFAAHLSGKAINITKTTAAHALSYGFTMRYGLPHGQAVMLTLPALFLHNAQAKAKKLNVKITLIEHQKRMGELCSLLGVQDPYEAKLKLEDMFEKTGLTSCVKCNDADKEAEIAALVSNINLERLGNNPVELTREELVNIVGDTFC